MEALEAQLVGLWPILRHEKGTKLIKCGRMQRIESRHPKCHKYKNYKDNFFLRYIKTKTNYATNTFKSKYKDV
jgi:hypothetical protein